MNRLLSNRSRRGFRGFTLTEMLVVLGIIVLVLAIALPAFTAVTGSRSAEAGTNIAAASVGRARAEAIRRGVTCGALFFVDLDGRTAVAFVALTGGETGTLNAGSDPDPYDEYKPYAAAADYQASSGNPLPGEFDEPPMTSDRVIALMSDRGSDAYVGDLQGYADRPIVVNLEQQAFVPEAIDAPGVNEPPLGFPDGTNASSQDYQGDSTIPDGFGRPGVSPFTSGAGGVSEAALLADVPVERMPAGVGLQVITGASLVDGASQIAGATTAPASGGGAVFLERYTRAGVIAFDRTGRMVRRQFFVPLDSPLARVMGLDTVAKGAPADSVGANAGYYPIFNTDVAPLASGFGVVVYREDDFASASNDGTALHWEGGFFASLDAENVIDDFRTTAADLNYSYPNFDYADPDRSVANEYAEERWLDSATTPLLVNRFSGTLTTNLGDQAIGD